MEAFEELLSRYEHRVYAFVAQHFGDPRDAREVTQDAFVAAYRGIHRYDPQRDFAAWLFTIARRKCIDRLRSTRWRESNEFLPEDPRIATPQEVLAAKEDQLAIWDLARRSLTPIQYHALWLRYAEDLDIPRIAQILRKSRIHVKVLLFRARQKLQLRPVAERRTSPSIQPLGLRKKIVAGPTVDLAARKSI